MPFTPAHPAIVLPFLKWRYVSATGLIIGTISPDFEYFFKMSVNDNHGHTLAGIFYFDLPVTFFLSFVFHQLVKERLIDNLPYFFQSRLNQLRQLDFINYFKHHWILFLGSSVAGAFLHIFWDGFTHMNGFFVQHIELLQSAKVPFDGVRYPLWYSMQYISSIIGLLIVIIFLVAMKPNPATVLMRPSIYYWLIIVGIIAIMLFLRFYWLPETLDEGNAVVSIISGLCVALVITGRIRFANHSVKIE